MTKILGAALLLTAVAQFATASSVAAPEIDAQSGVAALALLSGALLVIRDRQRK